MKNFLQDILWVFIIWCLASFFQHLVARVFIVNSTISIHIAIMGYSVLPLIPLIAIEFLIQPPFFIAMTLNWIAIIWATFSAYLAYIDNCTSCHDKLFEDNRRYSLIFPVLLMEIYMISLLPSLPK